MFTLKIYPTCIIHTQHASSTCGSHAYKLTACCIVRIPRVRYKSILYVCHARIICTQYVPSHTQTRLASLSEVSIMAQLPVSCTSKPFQRVPPCQLGHPPVHSARKGSHEDLFPAVPNPPLLSPGSCSAHSGYPLSVIVE